MAPTVIAGGVCRWGVDGADVDVGGRPTGSPTRLMRIRRMRRVTTVTVTATLDDAGVGWPAPTTAGGVDDDVADDGDVHGDVRGRGVYAGDAGGSGGGAGDVCRLVW